MESGLFAINSATGQISVAEGAVIDASVVDSHREAMEGQESKQFYSGEVRYRVGDQNAAIQVRIFVTQVMPGAPGRPTLAPETSSETGNPGLDASWTAADANGLTLTGYQVRYRKQGDTEWTPYSGTLAASAASATLPDLDATTTYEAQVRAVANTGAPADIFLSVDKASLRESTQSYYVNVTATRQGTSGEVTVAVAFSGTASMVVDYSPDPSNPTITIADGATSGTVELRMAVVTDGEKEGSETIILSGTAAGLTVGSVVVTVIDNDYPGEPITASPERFGPWSETGTGTTGERNSITLSVSPDTIGEDAGATEVTVSATLNAALAADTVVILALGGTAAAPADYSATSLASVTIPRGQTSAEGTLTITPVEDETAEGDESIEVTGSFKRFTVSPDTITLTDHDTATVGISGPTGEVAEGENAAFTVTLSAAIAKEVTVPWSAPLATDTAVAADLGATSGTVTFAAGSAAGATQTISIPITDDTTLEPAETFTVTLGAVGGDLAGLVTVDPASATATIAKDASFGAHITLSFNPEYVQEGSDVQVTFTATRDDTVGDHTVDWSVATVTPQTATNGTDFTKGGGGSCDTERNVDYFMRSLPTDVRIAPGESSASTTVTLHICADDLDEPNETISYTATAPGATFTEAVLTIGDPETITLSASPDTIAEDAGATETTVTATMSAARATDTVVDLTLAGTAADPADYTVTSLTSITIPKGQTTANGTLTITPVEDTVVEVDETITVSGESGARPVSSADITLSNVTQPAPVISFETAPASVTEGNDATYTIQIEGSRTTNVTVRFKTGAADDLATAGQDYTAVDQTITFTPTENTKTVTVSTTADTRFEVTEDFTVTLSNAQGGGGLTPQIRDGTKTTTINDVFTDNDAYPESYTLTATPASVGEGDGGTEITFTATLDDEGTFPYPVDVIVYVEGKAGKKGTANLTEDYTVAGSHGEFLIFSIAPRGVSGSGTLTLTPEDDSVVEGEETVVFTSAAGGGLTTSDTPTVTLTDNEIATSITLSVSPSVLREGSSDQAEDVTVTATLDSDATLSVPIEVTVSLEDGTAKGEDYSKATATVIIDEGETSGSGSLKVTVTGDDKSEPDETLNVTGTAKGFTVHPAKLTILDDDSTGRGNNISLTVSPSRVREAAGATVLSVTASLHGKDALQQDAVINLSLADGTATLAGGDYSAATGTVTIPAGQLYGTANFTFTPTNDAVVEGDETVLLNGALQGVNVSPATVTIINSSHADLSISGPSAAVAEGASATFTVTLSAAIAEEVSVAWSAAPNTAEAADYSPGSGSVTFAAGSAAGATQTFTVANDGRRAVGDGGELHGRAGDGHLARQRLRSAQVWLLHRGRLYRRERPHHRFHHRPLHRGRGRRHHGLHGVAVAGWRHADGGPHGGLLHRGRRRRGGRRLRLGIGHAHLQTDGGGAADLHRPDHRGHD